MKTGTYAKPRSIKRNVPGTLFAVLSCAMIGLLPGHKEVKAMQTPTATSSPIELRVEAARIRNHITPWMTGSCIEDVNHEIYGGLYAQQIFGESFEEPPRAVSPLAGWEAYGGQWRIAEDALHVEADAGAKLVRNGTGFTDGVVECDVRADEDKGGNAALLVRVSEPHTGPDNWIGYEISLEPQGHTLSLSRHRNDWHLLRSVPAPVKPGQWHHLRVELEGARLRITLDHTKSPVLEYTDGPEAILNGRIGVRTWNMNAAFRNLNIITPQQQVGDALITPDPAASGAQLSGMWDGLHTGTAVVRYDWDRDRSFNTAHAQRIAHAGGNGTVGIANRGLNRWGIAVQKGHGYAGSLYLRQQDYPGQVWVGLQSVDGTHTYARQPLAPVGTEWTRRTFVLKSAATDPNARFAFWIDRPGTVWIDQVTLLPTGRDMFHGLPFRADIAHALQQEGVTFLRYGGTMVNAPEYRWKKMIGPRDRRPQYQGNWYPHSTNGFGIEEFVQFCQAAGIEPAFAINIDETPEDAADLVEYLNGPVTSRWGQRRAANGHPLPYNVRTIEIGNEEGLDGNPAWYRRYLERFLALYPAMHARDPKVQLVCAAWWNPRQPLCKEIMQALNGKAALWDVHVDADNLHDGETADHTLTEMQQLFEEWSPGTTMRACIFEENGNRHDMQRALSHARIVNVTRRHGDFCLIDCPANCLQPWKQNDNGWDQGQVFFTAGQVWGMPPFYAQQMASANALPLCVESALSGASKDLDVTVTRSEDGKTLVISAVNVAARAASVNVQLTGFANVAKQADVWTLAGDLQAVNSPAEPERIRSQHTQRADIADHFACVFPAHSYTVLRLHR